MRYRLSILLLLTLVFSFSIVSAQSPDPIVPFSGTWEVTLLDEQNNCPAEIPLDDAWVPAPGSQHVLTFSTLDAVPFDLHKLVAPVEVEESPDFFDITRGDYNQYEIIPAIQTQPYFYRYAVLEEQYIVLEYTETLALSDCVLVATYSITLVSSDAPSTDGTSTNDVGNVVQLENWELGGDASDPTYIYDDPSAPNGALCGTDQSRGETWFFAADEAFINTVNASYGKTLSYDIRIIEGNLDSIYDDFDVELIVGNGIILHYTFGEYPTHEWTHFEVRLDETAGWIDVDGVMDTSDPALFAQMVQDITQVNIRGEYIGGSDSACIANVSLSDESGDMDQSSSGSATTKITLQSGLYETVVMAATPECSSFMPVGTTQRTELTFLSAEDGSLTLVIEGTQEVLQLVAMDTPNTYQPINGTGYISVHSPTEFTFYHDFGDCLIDAVASLITP